MLSADKLVPQGRGLAPVLLRRAARMRLDWTARRRSRFEATDGQGRRIGVVLAPGQFARTGDVLLADDGSLIVVEAAEQPVMAVSARPGRAGPQDLLRAAYHLGQRQIALAVESERLVLEPDTGLADMLHGLGLQVEFIDAPFEPEAGAGAPAAHRRAGPAEHGQAHRDHDHDHGHGHDPGHGHDHGHGHDDAHDHGHGHGHDDVHAQQRGHAAGPAAPAHRAHEPRAKAGAPAALGTHEHDEHRHRHEHAGEEPMHHAPEEHEHANAGPVQGRGAAGNAPAPAAAAGPQPVHRHGPGCGHDPLRRG